MNTQIDPFFALESLLLSLIKKFIERCLGEWSNISQFLSDDWGIALGIGIFLLLWWRCVFFLTLSLVLIFVSVLAIPTTYLIDPYLANWDLPIFNLPKNWFQLFIFNAIGTLAFLVISIRLATSVKEWSKSRFIQSSMLEREGKTDVRDLERHYPSTRRKYKPHKYFSTCNFFFGRGLKNKVIKILDNLVNKQHIAVTGPTGSGKGIILQSLMIQAIIKGQSTIYLDPNSDNIALRVLEQYAKRSKRPFIYIDLSGDTPQWNPWSSRTKNELEELCAAVFGLADNFDLADIYRLIDRDAAIVFAKLAANRKLRPVELISELLKVDSSIEKEAKKFFKDLCQLADLPVVNIDRGLDLLESIQHKSVIYVRGSTRNPRVLKLQRLFILAAIHAVEKRSREELYGPPVFLVIDEYKYSCSPQSTEALATIRKMGCHMAIASQSYMDLKNCPKDMDPDSVISSVIENAAIHINYKSNDVDLAETISKSTGSIPIDEEVRNLEANAVWAEQTNGHRSLRKGERNLLDMNMIMNMPEGCAALRWNGLSEIIHVCPVAVDMKAPLPQPTIFTTDLHSHSSSNGTSGELIDVD